jgi:hypothetical protein
MIDKCLIVDFMIWKASESGITISDIKIKSDDWIIDSISLHHYPKSLCYVDYKVDDTIIKHVYIKKESIDEYLQKIRDKRINLIIE